MSTPNALELGERECDDLKREREFLEGWLQIAGTPIGQECCCRPNRGECCGNPDPVYMPATEVLEQMGTRHREVCAAMATCKPDFQVAHPADQGPIDPDALEAAYMLGRRDGAEAERRRIAGTPTTGESA